MVLNILLSARTLTSLALLHIASELTSVLPLLDRLCVHVQAGIQALGCVYMYRQVYKHTSTVYHFR